MDDGVTRAWPDLSQRITSYLGARPDLCDLAYEPETVPGGERAKNGWNVVKNIMAAIGNRRLCRHSFVLAIGGGSVLDMVGFAASLVHRGVRLIRMPTTVLGQCDAGVGVKNGMDEHGMKNFVGTFAPPAAVINDYSFLSTLSPRYWLGGVSEAFKVALIEDAEFFGYLCEHAEQIRARDEAVMEKAVHTTAILHLEHIRTNGDPFELGVATLGRRISVAFAAHYSNSHLREVRERRGYQRWRQ